MTITADLPPIPPAPPRPFPTPRVDPVLCPVCQGHPHCTCYRASY